MSSICSVQSQLMKTPCREHKRLLQGIAAQIRNDKPQRRFVPARERILDAIRSRTRNWACSNVDLCFHLGQPVPKKDGLRALPENRQIF